MIKLRAVFEKQGRAKYISHLDLNRCILRTFRRSKLPVWYTEGFNPHPYFSFALALSLGYESSCEILDFNLNEEMPFDVIRDRLNAVMPEGMKIISVAERRTKITEITEAEYEITLSSPDIPGLSAAVEGLMAGDSINVEKKTKKGVKTVDIKPFIKIVSFEQEGNTFKLIMRLPAGTQTNYNPGLFLDALKNAGFRDFDTEKIRRSAILCEKNKIFF